jgi:2-hydroxychromene-2-carboxylate isomerase
MKIRTLEFWFEFASTYSYLAAEQVEARAEAAGVRIAWKPFLLGPIFRAQGWDDSPFNLVPAKGRYMWRDLARLCAKHGLAFSRPSVFPRNGLLAARVACAAASDPWLPDFVRAAYRANFARDRDIADPQVLMTLLDELGQPGAEILERAVSNENKLALRTQSERAAGLGIFGAPSFHVGSELFWGHDRLDDALAWCVRDAAGDADS